MIGNGRKNLRGASPYNAAMTREYFLFYEMRTTAKLVSEGFEPDAVLDRIMSENLFQYPTVKSVRKLSLCCLRRLEALGNESMVRAIAEKPSGISKQICLYAMMRQNYLMRDFMVTVIGDKYSRFDSSFGKADVNVFFLRLQEQDDWVATWSDSTVKKLKQVLINILVDNEYLDSAESNHLNPVWLDSELENAIRANHDEAMLSAFNCLD